MNVVELRAVELVSVLGLGLLAGAHHAISGPDHLAGVAPLAADRGRGAWRVGFGWGLGHASGATLAALVALALREQLPGFEERLSAVSETIVGVLLCAVGLLGLRKALGWSLAAHSHAPGEHTHQRWFARHAHARPTADSDARSVRRVPRSAYGLGVFHGAAGLSHLFAVLPALALPGFVSPSVYLAGYGSGSVIAIVCFASVLGRCSRDGALRPRRWILGLASAASVVVGTLWIVHPL